jgi:hypothetical protein
MGIEFFIGVITSYWFLTTVLTVALITEYNGRYILTALLTAVGLLSAGLIFNLSPMLLIAYLPAGLVWSFWRWRVYTKNCGSLAKEGNLKVLASNKSNWKEKNPTKAESRQALVEATLLLPNLYRIISWVICFPISMVESAVYDIIHVLKIAVTEWFSKVYRMSTSSALKDFDSVDNTETKFK